MSTQRTRNRAPAPQTIRITTSGAVTPDDVDRARKTLSRVLEHSSEPVLDVHVTLAARDDRSVVRPALVSVRVDFNGRPLNAHAAAPTVFEAIGVTAARLRLRLENAARDWPARRGAHYAR